MTASRVTLVRLAIATFLGALPLASASGQARGGSNDDLRVTYVVVVPPGRHRATLAT